MVDKALSAVRANDVRVWVKGKLLPVCPLLNGETYDYLGVQAKICTSLKLVGRECIEYAADMKRIALRTVEQARHNAKTAIKKKIKSKFIMLAIRAIYKGGDQLTLLLVCNLYGDGKGNGLTRIWTMVLYHC